MNFSERDIFDYVFFPENLSNETKKAIAEDPVLSETIDFYKKLLENSKNKVTDTFREKIAAKIPEYFIPKEILLYPVEEPLRTKSNNHRLAADSESKTLLSEMTSRTFVDKDNEYMIKVLNYESTTKIFVFSAKNEIVKNFDIILDPSEIRYHFTDNSDPLVVHKLIDAETIRVEFSK